MNTSRTSRFLVLFLVLVASVCWMILPSSRMPASTPYVQAISEDLRQCIENVCGPVPNFPLPSRAQITAAEESHEFVELWREVTPQLEKIVSQEARLGQRRGDLLNKAMGRGPKLLSNLSDDVLAKISFALIMHWISKDVDNKILNRSSVFDSRTGLESFAKRYALNPSSRQSFLMVANVANDIIENFPGGREANLLAKLALESLGTAKQLVGPLFIGSLASPESMRTLTEFSSLPSSEKFLHKSQLPLRKAALHILLINKLFKETPKAQLAKMARGLENQIQSIVQDEIFQIRIRNLSKSSSLESYYRQNLEKSCRAEFNRSYEAKLTSPELQGFGVVSERTRAAAFEVAKKYVPAEVLPRLKVAFESELSIALPKTFSQNKAEFFQFVTEWSRWLSSEAALIDIERLDLDVEILAGEILGRSPSMKDSLQQDCFSRRPFELNDRFDIIDNRIEVSWTGVKYPQYGISLLAHELGHFVAFKMSRDYERFLSYEIRKKASYYKTRECLNRRNPTYASKKNRPSGSVPYLEEDWADHFSGLVIQDLEQKQFLPAKPFPLGCFMLRAGSTAEQWSAESIVYEAGPNPYDRHSPPLYRLFFGLADQSILSTQCSNAFKKIESRLPLAACD